MNESELNLEHFLSIMVKRLASDLYFKVGRPPYIRVGGRIEVLPGEKFSSEDMEILTWQVIGDKQMEGFKENKDMDIAYHSSHSGRFRVNVFLQREEIGMVIREVKAKIPAFEELNLPAEVLKKLSMEPRGMILVTGPAGCGKSTTLAAMIEYVNQNKASHIITIEDPIEFLYEDKKSLINQRQIGVDTNSFSSALKHVVRQSPDTILIGEMRDLTTAEAAVMAAETGHLVLSTLHTINAPRTIERIINFFPHYQQTQLRVQLAHILKGVISLRLLVGSDGERIPAVSVMIPTPTIQKLIMEGRLDEIGQAMDEGKIFGMQTFTQALLNLYNEGKVFYETAMQMSDSPHEFELRAKGIIRGAG